MTSILVSYDDTPLDRDGLALGRALAAGGTGIALAYVRHDASDDRDRSAIDDVLARGARGIEGAATHVVTDRSTAAGLRDLAGQQGYGVVVMGSGHRTPKGAISLHHTTRTLLDGGPVAIAIAPVGFGSGVAQIRRIAVLGDADPDALATAQSLASAVGAEVVPASDRTADLLVVASRPETPEGRVRLSAASENAVELARSAVLVLPRGVRVDFGRQGGTDVAGPGPERQTVTV